MPRKHPQFLEAFFCSKVVILYENSSQNGPKMTPFGWYFLEKVQKQKSVFRLRRRARIACEPFPISVQGHQDQKNSINP